VEQELLTLPGHLRSPLVFSGVCVARSLVFCVVFWSSLWQWWLQQFISFVIRSDFIGTVYSRSDFIGTVYSRSDFIGTVYSRSDFIGTVYSRSMIFGMLLHYHQYISFLCRY
jgi:hypothetical protein